MRSSITRAMMEYHSWFRCILLTSYILVLSLLINVFNQENVRNLIEKEVCMHVLLSIELEFEEFNFNIVHVIYLGISLSRCFSIGVVIQIATLKEARNTKSITIRFLEKYNFMGSMLTCSQTCRRQSSIPMELWV